MTLFELLLILVLYLNQCPLLLLMLLMQSCECVITLSVHLSRGEYLTRLLYLWMESALINFSVILDSLQTFLELILDFRLLVKSLKQLLLIRVINSHLLCNQLLRFLVCLWLKSAISQLFLFLLQLNKFRVEFFR